MYPTIIVGIMFALIRVWIGFTCEPTPMTWIEVFKDLVHVYMGGLFVSAHQSKPWSWTWILFTVLCAIEVSVSLLQRMR